MSGCHIMTDVNAYRCVAIVVFLTEKPLYAIEAYYLKTGMPKLENVLLQLLQSLYSYVCVFFVIGNGTRQDDALSPSMSGWYVNK